MTGRTLRTTGTAPDVIPRGRPLLYARRRGAQA